MSENKDNKLTLINEKTANDYLTHTMQDIYMTNWKTYVILHFSRQIKGAYYNEKSIT